MYAPVYQAQVQAAENKLKSFKNKPLAYAVASVLAGFYIGLGLVISQYVKQLFAAADHPLGPVLTGLSFSLGLLLVFFAGAELFTGNNLAFGIGLLRRQFKAKDVLSILVYCWLFNFLGSFILGALFRFSGAGGTALQALMLKGTVYKVHLPVAELIIRGIFCNIFVCLAVLGCSVMKSAAAKAIFTTFCISTFVILGMEHCVANMSLFSFSLLFSPSAQSSLIGQSISPLMMAKNLFFVTLGNLIGGIGFVALPYHLAQEKNA